MTTQNRLGYHGSTTFPWRVRSLCPTSGTTNLGTCTRQMQPLKICDFGNQWGLHSGDQKDLWGPTILLFRGSDMQSLVTGLSSKAEVWEVTVLVIKEIHWAILRDLPEGQEPVGTSIGTEALVRAIFALAPTLLVHVGPHRHSLSKINFTGVFCLQCSSPTLLKP